MAGRRGAERVRRRGQRGQIAVTGRGQKVGGISLGQAPPGSVPIQGILWFLVGILGGFFQRLLEFAVQQGTAVAL